MAQVDIGPAVLRAAAFVEKGDLSVAAAVLAAAADVPAAAQLYCLWWRYRAAMKDSLSARPPVHAAQ